ncbi:U1 small nuclear ribonucleoprotein A [[Candida] anglica]|uniref:U1 small nuclear ribonucleoprotein A n=1 Tax=[Candida] anglica TaxID=148631 RepID=A0ABP0E9U1_9ASCO
MEENVNETLYLQNLNEKVSINTLKNKLSGIFSTYGKIIQLTAHKNLKMKGQAFITYQDIESAQTALKNLQKFIIFDKPVKISYSKSNSDNHYIIKTGEKDTEIKEIIERKEAKRLRNEAQRVEELKKRPSSKVLDSDTSKPTFDASKPKRIKIEDWKSLPPNNVLLIQNLPDSTTQESLFSYFETQKGFINVRFVKIRKLAFIEFDNEPLATEVLNVFESEKISSQFSDSTILTYAKK